MSALDDKLSHYIIYDDANNHKRKQLHVVAS